MRRNTQLNHFVILLCIGIAFILAYGLTHSSLRFWLSPISVNSLGPGPVAPPTVISTPEQPQPTIALADESAYSYHKRGNQYQQRGEYEQAIADFNHALAL